MYTTFHINTRDLNIDFLNGIKALFKNKRVSIIVEEEMDETEYLLSGEANRKTLEESLKSGDGYEFSAEEFDKLKKDLQKGKKIDFSKIKKIRIPG